MKAFKVEGTFQMGDRWQQFTKEVVGSDEEAVKEQVYSRLGSKHRVKRAKILISDVKEISLEEVSDPITKYLIEKEKTVEKKKIKKGEKNE
jgi:large subunit ribosomal protein LX